MYDFSQKKIFVKDFKTIFDEAVGTYGNIGIKQILVKAP